MNRRSLLLASAGSVVAGASRAAPAVETIAPAAPDPVYAALAAWSEAVREAWRDDTSDEEMERLVDVADTAAFALIRTRPTTMHGLKLLLIAAPEISRRGRFGSMDGEDGDDTMDVTFMRYLADAAMALLPQGPSNWLGDAT